MCRTRTNKFKRTQVQPTCFHSGLSLWKSECFACPKGFEPQNVCFDNGSQISGPKQCSCSCCSPVALVFITGLSWTRSRPKCTIHLQVFCLKTVWRCHVHQFCTKVKTASVRAYAAFSVHGMKWLVQIAVHLTFFFFCLEFEHNHEHVQSMFYMGVGT